MAIKDYSATPASNTAINGTGITGANLPSNFDNALREILADLAKMNAGTEPLQSTFKIEDATTSTKQATFDLASISAATTRTYTFPDVSAAIVVADGSAMRYIKTTYITASDATWAFDADTTVARVFILGGGGGGGAALATGATGVTVGASGNGGGWTTFEIDVAALGGSPTTNITIGAAGTGGTSIPTDGGNTTYNDGTTSITAQGGRAGTKAINSFSHLQARVAAANTATTGGDAPNNGQQAEPSISGGDRSDTSASVHIAVAGAGGGSPFGQGGAAHTTATTSGSSSLGNNGTGYGAGGSAAMRLHSASGTSAGGAGTAGLCVIVEYGDT